MDSLTHGQIEAVLAKVETLASGLPQEERDILASFFELAALGAKETPEFGEVAAYLLERNIPYLLEREGRYALERNVAGSDADLQAKLPTRNDGAGPKTS